MKPFLSLCMIVRNEAEFLERCLASVAPHVDEIIIIDTGSADETKEIAARFTANVFDFSWTNDFAKARNAAIAKASSPWIMMLDADEYLEVQDLSELRALLRGLSTEIPVGLVLPVYNFVGYTGSGKVSISKAMRIFTRHDDLRFDRPVHEQLLSRTGQLTELEFPLVIYHTGYTSEMIKSRSKNERNQSILLQMRNAGKFMPYDAFLMGNEHFSQDQYEHAWTYYQEANHPSQRDKTWLSLCIGNAVSCLIKLQRYAEAYEWIQSGIRQWPNACDFRWLEGYLLALIGYDDRAIVSLRECLRIANRRSDAPNWLISPNNGSMLPLQQLAVLYLRNFNVSEAVSCLTKLAYANPNQQAVLVQLLKLIRTEDMKGITGLLQSLYPAPEPYQVQMIGEACHQAGLTALAKHYGIPNTAFAADDMPQENLPQVVEVCMRLFRSGNFEAFDQVVVQYQNEQTQLAQMLGDAFFADNQFELALDYYSMLLQKNVLHGQGYENLARLYFAQNERNEGLDFLRSAIRLLPERIELYTLYLQQANEPLNQAGDNILADMYARFPGLRNFPLVC